MEARRLHEVRQEYRRTSSRAAKADSLMARIIPEPSTAVAEFETANVDVLYVPEGETRNWEQTDEKKAMLESAPALRVFYIAINTTRGPLADARVRQALNYATDAKGILEGIVSGRGNLAAGVIPPSLPGGDSTRKGYTRDVAKAKQLLAEAGIPERNRCRALVLADASLPAHCADRPGEPQGRGRSRDTRSARRIVDA